MMVFPDPERRDRVNTLSDYLPPIVILARTQMAENIGATARAMMTCGLSDLRLVAPRDGWPNPVAVPMAAGGTKIIENATLYDDIAAAAHDVSFIAAASARRRDIPMRKPTHALWLGDSAHQGKAALCLARKHRASTMMKSCRLMCLLPPLSILTIRHSIWRKLFCCWRGNGA